jgi:hypothetical protein
MSAVVISENYKKIIFCIFYEHTINFFWRFLEKNEECIESNFKFALSAMPNGFNPILTSGLGIVVLHVMIPQPYGFPLVFR